ncbi:GPALPP motifs-containing protein 1 [Cebus imitator]|uniref:GPALPP motifs-containing protein 1 n=1 Tax=Cebus imitator TaxID=2715852 RepID=UPI001897E065|nr:GPALPP motifs-containing protein 1 [Cebus imitator]
MARDLIGPALPPGFKARGTAEDEERDPSPVAGPALPPNYKSSSSDSSDSDEDSSSLYEEGNQESEEDDTGPTARKQRKNQDDDDDDGFFGPALPPGFKKQDDSPPRPIIGPALPPGFIKATQKSDKGRDDPEEQETDSSEDEDIVGPMPAKGPVNYNITTEFEKRAQRMKEKLTKGDDVSFKDILGNKLNRLKIVLSVFIPQETQEARKSSNKKDEEHVLSGRDKRLAEQVSSYNESKRSESLMDIHHKKLKSKAAEDKNKPQERIPFDRDKDLKVNRFDEAQKKALIKKSRELNTRFSHGKGNMFL